MFKKIFRYLILVIGIILLISPIALDYKLFTNQQKDINSFQKNFIYKKSNKDGVIDYTSLRKPMAIIYIPKIKVTLPVFEGTSDEVISTGVGHLETSDKIGAGKGTHSVLTSHSGLSINQLFTSLYKLKKNDVWYVKDKNNKIYEYKVREINKVLPTDTSKLKRQEGKELMTLLTCTPLFINTHRLLVMGERVPLDTKPNFIPHYDFIANNYLYIIVIVLAISLIVWFTRKKK